MRQSTMGSLFVLGAAVGFGTIGIFGRVAVAIEFPLASMLPIRFAIATLVVLALAFARDWVLPESRRDWVATLFLGVIYTAMTLCFFGSLRFLTAGIATIVLYTYPTFVVVLAAILLGERVTVRTVLALGLATGGVALVVRTGAIDIDAIGVALALGAAAFYAVYTTGSRMLSPSISPRGLMIGILLGTTASMSIYGVIDGRIGMPAGADEWGVVLGLALVSTVIPHLLFYEGVARLEAGRVGVVSTAEPVVTVALGTILLGEPVTAFLLVGGVLVLAGVVLVQLDREETAPMPEAPAVAETEQ